jgi:hypothetical protein
VNHRLAWNLRSYWRNRNTDVEDEMVININEFRKAKAAKATKSAASAQRDSELLCVNWSPAYAVVALSCYQTPQEMSPQLPDEFEGIDMTSFMGRLRALSSQI